MDEKVMYQNFEIEEIRLETIEDFEEKLEKKDIDYYRGESDSQWYLNSSIVRKIKKQKENEKYLLDLDKLKKLTESYRSKYNQKISDRHSLPRVLFYLQHSISFSPFIDITKKLWVAVSFCLEDIQKDSGAIIDKDAAIYTFKVAGSQEKNSKVLNTQKKVEAVLENLSIGINRITVDKKSVEAYIININDLALLNDRMQYQNGSFLLLNNYSITKSNESNQIYDDSDIKIVKYILSKKLQEELFFKLRNHYNEYVIKYLYDPYLFLE